MGVAIRVQMAAGKYQRYHQATLEQVCAVLARDVGRQPYEEVLKHLRYIDLKATGGTGNVTTEEVRTWVRVPEHRSQVVWYWLNDRPEYTILQGVHAQRVFEEIAAPVLCAHNVKSRKLGLLHPSQQNTGHLGHPAYTAALKHVHQQLRWLDEPLVRWVRGSKKQTPHWGVLHAR